MLNVIIYGLIPRFDWTRLKELLLIFLLFSCVSGSWVPLGTLPNPFIRFNLMTNFSDTRAMKFHRSGWFSKYQNKGILKFQIGLISLLWVWIGLNYIFGLWDTSAMDFKGKNWINNFQKIIFHYLKIDAFQRIASRISGGGGGWSLTRWNHYFQYKHTHTTFIFLFTDIAPFFVCRGLMENFHIEFVLIWI